MYTSMFCVIIILLFLQCNQGYSKTCLVEPHSDLVENAALNKSASQISDYSIWSVASKAVDGDKNPHLHNRSCIHTRSKDDRLYRWWMVDLAGVYRIDSVNITNRSGYKAARKLRAFDIFVSLNSTFEEDDHMADQNLCIHVPGEMGDAETRTFPCQSHVFGQFVQIYMETLNLRNLNFCEVTVQGYPAVCIDQPMTQSVSVSPFTTSVTVPAPPMCPCLCNVSSSSSKNLTQEALVELVKELAEELTVNKKETSMSKRKLISVGDERQSAETIGFIGVLALCVPVLLIVSFDLINLWSLKK